MAAGFSQEVLAERASISKNGISALERGASFAPQRETLGLLVNALQLDAEQQLALEEAAFRPTRPRDRKLAAHRTADNNLPRALSSFVGRENEIDDIRALVDGRQLVTIVGFGGVGKTRTSLRVAANMLDRFRDGVWFVELAPLSSGDYVTSAIAQTLGVTVALDDASKAENLARALKNKNALVLLDNCEHVMSAAAAAVAAIVRRCPSIKIVATSRERLGITGEMVYRLEALSVESASALFEDRARLVDRGFIATGENATVIAKICRELDYIPLGIELAASRVNVLSVQQLRERLRERFRILTGAHRDALPRQQTLRALIDWSFELLDERERALFRRLGIFANGFTIEAAAAVGRLGDEQAIETLASLVEKSLVGVEDVSGARRFRLLESVRYYAREKLQAAGEWDGCARECLHYLCELFFDAGERYERTARSRELGEALERELEDVRAALDWAAGNDPLLGATLLADIRSFWWIGGLHSEGISRINAMLVVLEGEQDALRARLWATVAFLAGELLDSSLQAQAAAKAVAHARACSDPAALRRALLRAARSAATDEQLAAAEAALEEAAALPHATAADRVQLLGVRAVVSMMTGDLAAAGNAYEQLRAEHRSLGNVTEERGTILNLAENEHARGQTQRAIALLREALPEIEAGGDRTVLATAFANFAGYLNAVDDASSASAMARKAIEVLAPNDPNAADVAVSMEHLALATALCGDFTRAAVLEGYADASLRDVVFKRQFTEAKTHDRIVDLLMEHLSSDERARLFGQGERLAPAAALAFALAESPRTKY